MSHRRSARVSTGVWALVVALVGLVVLTFLPAPYVIQQPGPVFDTLGTAEDADGKQVPLIAVDDAKTYETDGTLDLTTVQVVGNRMRTPSWIELAIAWFDRSRAVVPIDAVFPEGVTTEERDEQNAALMVDSQHEATAAALSELGYDVGAAVKVVDVVPDLPAEGKLKSGDVIVAMNGEKITVSTRPGEIVQKSAGEPVDVTILRDGKEQSLSLTPEEQSSNGTDAWLLGVTLTTEYDFPIDVHIQLNNVGGPSAGMMFALGIIDTLTPEEITGGERIAGTGTIAGDGTVGPIGGIRHKLYGARDAGAEYFLAPAENCDEVSGHIPDGLTVFSTKTLDDSLHILDVIADHGDTAKLPSCPAG